MWIIFWIQKEILNFKRSDNRGVRVDEGTQNPVLSLTLDSALYVGRHDFGSVNPEIWIIEVRIIPITRDSIIYILFNDLSNIL